jgi:RNA polymerase sigma factor (sigma-70 family)
MSLSHTDLSLLERMGDSRYRADAWAVFVDRYTQLFFTWFKHWGVDPYSMEDVFQESMIRVLGDIKSFHHQRKGSFRAWLKALARNSWLQLIEDTHRQMAQREVDPIRVTNWGLLSQKNAANHLLELFDSWAAEEVLNLAMSRVRVRCTSDVWETYERISFRNESVSNVSVIMNIPSVQVYDRVSHIRKLIRIELAEMEAADS